MVAATIQDAIQSAFGDLGPDVVRLMTAIAMAESGGNPAAHNPSGEDSRGILQINVGPGANTDLAGFNLFDPYQNAQAARIVYDRQGPGAWSVYTNGAYQQFLDGASSGGGSAPLLQPIEGYQLSERPNRDPLDRSRVNAPLVEQSPAAPQIDPMRIGPPDFQMLAPLLRQLGAFNPFPAETAALGDVQPAPLIQPMSAIPDWRRLLQQGAPLTNKP